MSGDNTNDRSATETERWLNAEHMYVNDEHTYVGAYWGDRAEGPASAAVRVTVMLDLLAPLGRGFTDWVADRDRALPAGDGLVAWFEKAYEIEKMKGHPKIGVHVAFLSDSGREASSLAVGLTVGSHAANPKLGNAVVMRPSSSRRDDVLSAAPVDVVLALARAWEPDWVVASTSALRNMVVESLSRRGRAVKPGVVTWLADGLVTPQVQAVLTDLGAERAGAGWLVDCRDAQGHATPESVLAVARPLVEAGL